MARALAALLALVLLAGYSIAPRTAYLGWLSGRWVHEGPDGWAEESWTPSRAGVMLGTGLNGKGAEAAGFEFMRIADGPDGVTFWGSPGGRAPVAFPLVEQGTRDVAFENPRHDYPTRISYRREGRVLIATISGPGGANAQSVRYRRVGR